MRRGVDRIHLAIAIVIAITMAAAFHYLAHLPLQGSIVVAAILSVVCLIGLHQSKR
jgi:hypothetical protein